MMAWIALGHYVTAALVVFVVRTWLHRRRTGQTGLHGVSGALGSLEWLGGVLFVAAMILGLLGPLLAVLNVGTAQPPRWVQIVGVLVALAGFAATCAAQAGMGASWRIGVDPDERTDLVLTGVFQYVRNPIFTAMTVALIGLALIVPSIVSVLAVITLIAAVELQVRVVEEPYLRALHGDTYQQYTEQVGRFVPRLRSAA